MKHFIFVAVQGRTNPKNDFAAVRCQLQKAERTVRLNMLLANQYFISDIKDHLLRLENAHRFQGFFIFINGGFGVLTVGIR